MADASDPAHEEDQAELREFLIKQFWRRFSRLPPAEWDEQVRIRLEDERRRFTSAMEVNYILAACISEPPFLTYVDEPNLAADFLKLGASTTVMRQAENLPLTPCLAFLCHSSDDKPRIREIREYLAKFGVKCWLDEVEIVGGQDWEEEIRGAIGNATVVLVCLSRSSVSKAGFIQRELKFALDHSAEQPDGSIYLIPVRLEECLVPRPLQKFQRVDLFRPDGYYNLLRAIQTAAMTPREDSN